MPEVEEILRELGIPQYTETFIEQGFDTWETVLEITESDFDALHVKLGHRRKLQKKIAEFHRFSTESATGQSPRDTLKASPFVTPLPVVAPPVAKRRYRRHPKPDENAPERPSSAYVIFSNKMRDEVRDQHLSFAQMAKLAGEKWQDCSLSEKEPYERQANVAKEQYIADLAAYKSTDAYKQYAKYLAEFKAKQAAGESSKRLRRQESSSENVGSSDTLTSKAHLINSYSSSSSGTGRYFDNSPGYLDRGESEDSSVPIIDAPSSGPSDHYDTPLSAPYQQSPSNTLLPREILAKESPQQRSPLSAHAQPLPLVRSPAISRSDRSPSSASIAKSDDTSINTTFAHSSIYNNNMMPPPLNTEHSATSWYSSIPGQSPRPRTLEPSLNRVPPNPLASTSSQFEARTPSVRNMVQPYAPTSFSHQLPALAIEQYRDMGSSTTFEPYMRSQTNAISTDSLNIDETQEALDPVSALLRAGKMVEAKSWKRRAG